MAGFFFCLAFAEGAGLLFCPDAIQPYTSVYKVFCRVNAIYTSHATKQRTRLYSGLSRDCTRSTAHNTKTGTGGYNTACDTLEGIHAPGRVYPIPDTTATLGRCTGQHRPPIIIRYIRWQTMPAAGSRCFPRPAACSLAPGQ